MSFPAAGVYEFDLNAYGSLANGIGPQMELRLDQVTVAALAIQATTLRSYKVNVGVTSGQHRVAIAFTNDAWTDYDRNLYIGKTVIAKSPVPLFSTEAVSMPTKVGCGRPQSNHFYGQYCNGYVETELTVNGSDHYLIEAHAYGTYVEGAWPILEVRIDGQALGATHAATPVPQAYVLTGPITAGVHKLQIAFTNDYFGGSRASDRNLFLGRVSVFPSRPDHASWR